MEALKNRWIRYAELIDAFRIVPRLILAMYAIFLYDICQWFMALENPGNAQSAFIVTVVGIAGVVVGLYQNSGRQWGKNNDN